jgi:hypothetical protein
MSYGFNVRLCEVINSHGSNVKAFAESIGVARRSVHRWINGSQEPMPIYLHRTVALWPDVDLHWLITGETFNREEK